MNAVTAKLSASFQARLSALEEEYGSTPVKAALFDALVSELTPEQLRRAVGFAVQYLD